MKILLLGEYSNLHATLAEGLRQLGHEVLVVSDGTTIYNYKRDISLYRKGTDTLQTISYIAKLLFTLPRLRGFDVVQLINPDFLALKASRQYGIYNFLRRHNKKVVLGAFGTDWQWIQGSLHQQLFRYSDFSIGTQLRQEPYAQKAISEWDGTEKGELSQYIANDCDAIVSCLYEYHAAYQQAYPDKEHFIPLPIKPKTNVSRPARKEGQPVRFFLGIKRNLMSYKGTDLFYQALKRLKEQYPTQCEITIVEDLPFDIYEKKMNDSDVILDQAYSYTPAMNALEAMSKGLICVGGGEPENYEILNEHELRPIINVLPNEDDIYRALEELVLHPERIPELQQQSVEYIKRHHDYMKVAKQYEQLYQSIKA